MRRLTRARASRNKALSAKEVVAKVTHLGDPASSEDVLVGQGVSVIEFSTFWETLTAKGAAELIGEIVSKSIELDKKIRKKKHHSLPGAGTFLTSPSGNNTSPSNSSILMVAASSSSALSSHVDHLKEEHALHALSHTIDFIQYFVTVDVGHTAFVRAKAHMEKFYSEHSGTLHPALDRCRKAIGHIVANYERDTSNLVNYVLVDASYIQEEERKDISQDYAFSFSYIQFYAHTRGHEAMHDIYAAYKSNFTGMLKAAERQPAQFISTIENLLHVLSELLVIGPPVGRSRLFLLEIRTKIESVLLLWPKKYATFAKQVLQLLNDEIADPGILLRRRLLYELPFLAGKHGSDTPSVLVLYDPNTTHANILGELLQYMNELTDLQEPVTPQDLLENLLKLGISYSNRGGTDELLHASIENAPDSKVLAWLEKLLDVDEPQQSSPRDMYTARTLVLAELDAGLAQQSLPYDRADSGSSLPHWVKVPSCKLDVSALSQEEYLFTASATLASRSIAATSTSLEDFERHVQPSYHIPNYGINLNTSERIVVIGENTAIHKLLCAIFNGPRDKKSLSVFLIPTGRNDLGCFLASSDAWYKRHVYSPFCSQLKISPPIDRNGFQEDSHIPRPLGRSNPLQVVHSLLSDYVQSATEQVHIQLFEVHCWKSDECSDDDAPDVIIPCCCQLELGLNNAVNRYMAEDTEGSSETRDRASSSGASSTASAILQSVFGTGSPKQELPSKWHQALLDRNFCKSGIGPGSTPEMKVSIQGVDLSGRPVARTTELTPRSFIMFSAYNVTPFMSSSAANSQLTHQPYQANSVSVDPRDPWLELNWIPQNPSTQYIQDTIKRRDKKLRDIDLLAENLIQEQVKVLACQVDLVATRNTPILISVDQMAYGPYFRIKLVPSKQNLAVKTFTPSRIE